MSSTAGYINILFKKLYTFKLTLTLQFFHLWFKYLEQLTTEEFIRSISTIIDSITHEIFTDTLTVGAIKLAWPTRWQAFSMQEDTSQYTWLKSFNMVKSTMRKFASFEFELTTIQFIGLIPTVVDPVALQWFTHTIPVVTQKLIWSAIMKAFRRKKCVC